MSRSPKYSAVRPSEERRQRLERERQEREHRRRQEEAARAAAALEKVRAAALRQLAEVERRAAALGDEDQQSVLSAVGQVRRSIAGATTVDAVSTAVRGLDEIGGMTEQLARQAEQRRAAVALVDEIGARLAGLVSDARETDILLQDLTVAEEALQFIRTQLAADRPLEVVRLARQFAVRLDDIEQELDSSIERISARREMLGSIVEALPALGFAVDAGSLRERADGSIGVHARRRTGEPLAVLVQDSRRDEFRVNYLREIGTTTVVLDSKSCLSLVNVAELLNESVRENGFEPGPVTWEGDDGTRPPSSGSRARKRDSESFRSEGS